jgi:hypothetical protein
MHVTRRGWRLTRTRVHDSRWSLSTVRVRVRDWQVRAESLSHSLRLIHAGGHGLSRRIIGCSGESGHVPSTLAA